jgi:two-component system, cell cycle sensor histidine kinase and response regulator CckA
VAGKAEKLIQNQREIEISRGSETILLVEDDETLRKLTAKLLQDNGYSVLEAQNAEQAERSLSANYGQIDLLLTDVILPGKSGSELVKYVTEEHPQVRSVFMSGYAGDLVARCGVAISEATFLEKPFTRASLLSKVHAVLHGGS